MADQHQADAPKPRTAARGVVTPEAFAQTEAGIGDQALPPADAEPRDEEALDPMIGRVLSGLYKVEDRIGEGGMGTVYMAMHIHLDKPFAVKVLSRSIASNKEAMERFKQEAKAASGIDHENIVDVVNFDATDEGEVFIVMELLRGTSLADILLNGPLPLAKAIPIACQVCRALNAAHHRGIVHRDLKPENVFIVRRDDADFVKILDFGISRVRSSEAEKVRMTKTGQLVGTPLYMSPEQAKGEAEIDRRADIYSLGVMLYEMLTGTPPFEGRNYFQLLWKHGNEPPDAPSERAPDAHIPPEVEAAILKALAKDPEERFETMADFEHALLEATPGLSMPPRLVSLTPSSPSLPARSAVDTVDVPLPPQRSPWLYAAAGAALIGVGVAVAFAMSGDETGNDPVVVPEEPQGLAQEDPPDNPPDEPVVAPDPVPDPPIGVDPPPDVLVHFESRPSGAVVWFGDRRLGVTPVDAPMAPSDTPVEVRFALAGHRDAVQELVPAEGARVEVRMIPRRQQEGGESSSFKKVF